MATIARLNVDLTMTSSDFEKGIRLGPMRTLTNKKLRAALYYAYDGKCAICGCELPDDWHADHIVPWVVSHDTNVHKMQPLCPSCNRKKGTKQDDSQTSVLSR